jgi:hypothetical protein
MFTFLLVATIFFVSIAWAQALAHGLELPGKMRLDKSSYIATQSIYYPGFTIAAGFGEGLGMVSTFALLLLTSRDSPEFPLTAVALASLVVMHGIYWAVTHKVNKFWVRDLKMADLGAGFFSIGKEGPVPAGQEDRTWIRLRDRWEYSHVARAFFAGIALLALATAAAL